MAVLLGHGRGGQLDQGDGEHPLPGLPPLTKKLSSFLERMIDWPGGSRLMNPNWKVGCPTNSRFFGVVESKEIKIVKK